MVLLVLFETSVVGATSAYVKLFQLAIHFNASGLQIFGYFSLVALCWVVSFITTNIMIAIYRQVDYAQIFSGGFIMMTILSGLLLFDEIQFYDAKSLCGVFGACALCLTGLCIIAFKHAV